jgi:metal-responsive CopG/Arc/MetJ family transcriptional regulator
MTLPRRGAGRPPTGRPRKVRTSITIDAALLQWTEEEAERRGASRSSVVEEAVREALRVAAWAALGQGEEGR